jgi:Uma2 family endonuclease
MVSQIQPNRMTADEYLAWDPMQAQRYEYWDGEVLAMSGGTRDHNRVSANCFRLLDDALAGHPCEVFIVDVKVQVEADRHYFYPDVVVTCDDRDTDPQIVKFPCLIIEVLSASTEAYDRGIKFAKYRQLETLQDYLLVSVNQPRVDHFRRNDRKKWEFLDYTLGDQITLESISVELAVADFYRFLEFDPNRLEDL